MTSGRCEHPSFMHDRLPRSHMWPPAPPWSHFGSRDKLLGRAGNGGEALAGNKVCAFAPAA